MQRNGSKIVEKINELEKSGVAVVRKLSDKDGLYDIEGEGFRAKVKIEPEKWLGIELSVQSRDHSETLTHTVDTDLYDISDPDEQLFATEIEDDIVDLLNNLLDGRVLIGENKSGRFVAIIPTGDYFQYIKKGKLFVSSRIYTDLDQAKSNGDFKPLELKSLRPKVKS